MPHEKPAGFQTLYTQTDALLLKKRRMVLAIDGRCGSGKSMLAGMLEQRFPAQVLHMDDFYLPFAERAPGWAETPCANMDLQRFLAEVLRPVRKGQPFLYRRYDCHAGRFLDPAELPPMPLTIIEGSYSHHPLLRSFYDYTVFSTCPPCRQLQRLREREGANLPAFLSRWMPLEERYFAWYGIENNASLVIRT